MKFLDIFNDIEFKGNKANIILKWVIAIAISAVVVAFILGQWKMRHLNKLENIEKLANENKKALIAGFRDLNAKIDNIYNVGLEGFEEYRIFNNQQLELIIEFGQSNEKANRDLLTRMLRMNSEEKARQIENQIEKKRREMPKPVIGVKPMDLKLPSEAVFTNVETNISVYYADGAPENYLDTLNLAKYEILEKKKSEKHEGLYDFTYKDKEK